MYRLAAELMLIILPKLVGLKFKKLLKLVMELNVSNMLLDRKF